MIELLVGLAAGLAASVPALWVLHDRLKATEINAFREKEAADLAVNRLLLKLEARSFQESVSVEALLNRPDPEPEVRGRWLHSDDGLVTQFVPDSD